MSERTGQGFQWGQEVFQAPGVTPGLELFALHLSAISNCESSPCCLSSVIRGPPHTSEQHFLDDAQASEDSGNRPVVMMHGLMPSRLALRCP